MPSPGTVKLREGSVAALSETQRHTRPVVVRRCSAVSTNIMNLDMDITRYNCSGAGEDHMSTHHRIDLQQTLFCQMFAVFYCYKLHLECHNWPCHVPIFQSLFCNAEFVHPYKQKIMNQEVAVNKCQKNGQGY